MNFKEKIQAHNMGEYDLTNEIIEIALNSPKLHTIMTMKEVTQPFYNSEDGHYTLTFRRWRPSLAEGETFEEQLARTFKFYILRYTKKANNIRKTNLFEGHSQTDKNENDILDIIYTNFTDLGYHFFKDEFDKIPQSAWKEIKHVYGEGHYNALKREVKEFLKILPRINRDKQKLLDDYLPLLKESVNEIIQSVDLSRNEKEIIVYIVQGTEWRLQRKITKLLESKVHQIGDKKYFLTKEQIRAEKFIKTKANTILQINVSKLTANQYDFYDILCKNIEEESRALNIEPFTFDELGNAYRINQAFFADKIGIKRDTFRKRLSRLPKI